MTKREGFKSLAERLGRDCSSPNPDDLINALDAMFTELREELCVAPSHAQLGEIEAVAEAWASIDGKLEVFRQCKTNRTMEDLTGRYGGYMADAESLVERIAARGFILVAADSARDGATQENSPAKTSGPEVTRQPLDDEWIKTVREAISTPAEPEVTEEMLEAGERAWEMAPLPFVGRLLAVGYPAMRLLEPQRPVEITEETVVRAHMAYVMTRDATSESPPRRVMVAMRAALEAALNPPPQ